MCTPLKLDANIVIVFVNTDTSLEFYRFIKMTTEVIIITLMNLVWGFVWFEVGRWIGRKENEK